MSTAKSYDISKLTVWEAYQSVKANRGAAGIDEQSIAQFEQKLQRNLYKLWNRMSSGSYLPPPVRQVEIPKQSGGKRKLGIPTVADRVAQTVVKLLLSNVTAPLTQHSNRLANPGCCAPDFLLAPIRHDATSMQKSKISSPNRRLLKIHRRPTCSGQVGHQSRGI